jgi:transglutaminase-like putative cysteine protease
MAIRVALNHKTEYRYDRPVNLSPQEVRLRPAVHCRTPITGYSLKVHPGRHFINWQHDAYGNYLARLVFPEKTRALTVEVDLVAELTVINPFDFFIEPHAEHFPFSYPPERLRELIPFLETEAPGELLCAYLADIRSDLFDEGARSTEFLVELNRRLQHHIAYTIRMAPGVQTCEETLAARLGSLPRASYPAI